MKLTWSRSISLRAFCTPVPTSLAESSTSSSTWRPEYAAFGVDLIDRELGAHHLVAGWSGVDAGEGIDHADPDRRLAACLNEERK